MFLTPQSSSCHSSNSVPPAPSYSSSWSRQIGEWFTGLGTQAWLASMLLHLIVLLALALVLGTIQVVQRVVNAPSFIADQVEPTFEPELAVLDLSRVPEETTVLDDATLRDEKSISMEEQFHNRSSVFQPGGGGLTGINEVGIGSAREGFAIVQCDFGPRIRGGDALRGGGGTGNNFGHGGSGTGFGPRGEGSRMGIVGATIASERAVAGGLNWIARHQGKNGGWSLDHRPGCKNAGCSGSGDVNSDMAATALALLPFLAAGQTHQGEGPYRRQVEGGLTFLLRNQKSDGDLAAGSDSQMYTHGLATIALCEAFGMTGDSRVRLAAQRALNFIQSGQNAQGSWRYTHGSVDSDTSVHGWQVMALKSGQMAGLEVSEQVIRNSRNYLRLVGTGGQYKEQFGYTPGGGPTMSMTSVGLLTTQYLGANRDDPAIVGGVEYLIKNRPSLERRNVYYWYYATQVMHNVQGPRWDEWNRAMRSILIKTQEKSGCEAGSWDPLKPSADAWGRQGGRLMCTSLSCLTLEVYYRYLPLYKLDVKNIEMQLNGM